MHDFTRRRNKLKDRFRVKLNIFPPENHVSARDWLAIRPVQSFTDK
jgi:hypothetical protein